MSLQATLLSSIERCKGFYTRNSDDVELIEQDEQRIRAEQRIRESGIPREFERANIASCPPAVLANARQVYAWFLDNQRLRHQGKRTQPSHSSDLLLVGKLGRGKTYAACASLVACAPVCRIKFVSSQQIAEWAWNRDKEMLSRCKGVDFLVIDDLGNEEPRGIQAVKAILDARRCERPTIVTTQLTPDIRSEQFGDLYGVETAKAMQSRLALMKSVSFTGADRRSRQ